MSTRETYVARFASESEALDYEQTVLSVGREYLPASARAVLDGEAPTPEYWAFLASQIDEASR